jgi:hypothetical protein
MISSLFFFQVENMAGTLQLMQKQAQETTLKVFAVDVF